MARRCYISQDKHLADAVRRLVREYDLTVVKDGQNHTRLLTARGEVVGNISSTAFSGPATLKTLAHIRRRLAALKKEAA